MSDSFEARGDFSPEILSTESDHLLDLAVELDTPEVPAEPNGFELLGLAPELVQACADLGYVQPTQVQNNVVPKAMLGEGEKRFADLMVSSQTGSGKTAAFLLPVLHTLLQQQAQAEANEKAEFDQSVADALARGEVAPKRAKRKDPTNPRNFKAATPGALILCPTRELAQQVANDAIDLVRHCRGLRIANVVGGMPYQLQIAKLQNADLVVATPGRLLDLQRSQQLKLDQVQFLVVDEADRMLDLGFADELGLVAEDVLGGGVAQRDGVEFLELKGHAGVHHILCGGAVVHPLAMFLAAACLQLLERGNQRMLDATDLGRHLSNVDVGHLGLRCDLFSGCRRNDAELGLCCCERGLEIEPFLDAVFFAEDGAQFVGAPQMLERLHVENGNGHGSPEGLVGGVREKKVERQHAPGIECVGRVDRLLDAGHQFEGNGLLVLHESRLLETANAVFG